MDARLSFSIVRCTPESSADWHRLRTLLWPGECEPGDIPRQLAQPERFRAFLAYVNDAAVGFAEASLRRDYVNGCATSPVVFLEGILVEHPFRKKGIARALCAAVERWGREAGCTEFGSDALLVNEDSHRMHAALGFEETERVVYFHKPI